MACRHPRQAPHAIAPHQMCTWCSALALMAGTCKMGGPCWQLVNTDAFKGLSSARPSAPECNQGGAVARPPAAHLAVGAAGREEGAGALEQLGTRQHMNLHAVAVAGWHSDTTQSAHHVAAPRRVLTHFWFSVVLRHCSGQLPRGFPPAAQAPPRSNCGTSKTHRRWVVWVGTCRG